MDLQAVLPLLTLLLQFMEEPYLHLILLLPLLMVRCLRQLLQDILLHLQNIPRHLLLILPQVPRTVLHRLHTLQPVLHTVLLLPLILQLLRVIVRRLPPTVQ